MSELTKLLHRFSAVASSGPYDYENCYFHDGNEHDYHVVIGSLVHGNEVGSLPAVVSLVEALASGELKFGGRLTVFLGNPEASLEDKRFLEADLNRVFTERPPDCHEGNRAQVLKPILDDADVFFDLHQTGKATDRAFYICPFDTHGWHWARAVGGASSWVTRAPGKSFSAGTVNADEYVRLQDKPGLTLELSELGFSEETDRLAAETLRRVLVVADAVGAKRSSVEEAARQMPELEFVHTTWKQSFDDPLLKLRQGLRNFQKVAEGELLSAPGTPKIAAPHDGLILFPKYPVYEDDGVVEEPRPGEIVVMAQQLEGHPKDVWRS